VILDFAEKRQMSLQRLRRQIDEMKQVKRRLSSDSSAHLVIDRIILKLSDKAARLNSPTRTNRRAAR
jgi:hypothetical protein